MTTLYDIFPGLTPDAQDVLEAETLMEQIIQANYPDLDTRIGTAMRDLLMRPAATLAAILNKANNLYWEQANISNVTNDTSTDFVDKLLSNWFLDRKIGTASVINARLYFARQKDITVTTDVFFSPDNTLRYFPSDSFLISADQLTFDSFANEYYYDLDLTAEAEGTDYNISTGSLLYFSNFDPYFLHAEINYLKAVSTLTETNTDFVARAQTAISTRNLINTPSIAARMLEDFPLLGGVTSIGFSDPEMLRDQIVTYVPSLTPPTVLIHNGGCVDVYCRVPISTGIVQFITNNSGVISMTGAVYDYSRSQISGGAADDTVPFYTSISVSSINRSGTTATVITATPHGYSNGQSITILGASQLDYNITAVITVTNATTFTYQVANAPVTPATGTITSNIPTSYVVSNPNVIVQSVTTLVSSGTVATATCSNHNLPTGRYVTIQGAVPSGYNGEVFVTSVTRDTFTYNIPTSLTTPATGTIFVSGVSATLDFGFSDKQQLNIDFGVGNSNKTASFLLNFFQDIDGLQSYLVDASRKVLCGDYLARGYNFYYLSVLVTGYNGTAPDSTTCNDIVTAYLGALAPGELFIMADLLAKLNAGGITTIKTPLDITYKYYNRDLLLQGPKTGTITDYLDPNDRTALFILSDLATTTTNI